MNILTLLGGSFLKPCQANTPAISSNTEFSFSSHKQQLTQSRPLGIMVVAEVRSQVPGGSQSYYPNSSLSSEQHSMVSVSLLESLDKACTGEMDPHDLFSQLPIQIQKIIQSLSKDRFAKAFDILSSREKREILGILRMAAHSTRSSTAMPTPSASVQAVKATQASKTSYLPIQSATVNRSRRLERTMIRAILLGMISAIAFMAWRFHK